MRTRRPQGTLARTRRAPALAAAALAAALGAAPGARAEPPSKEVRAAAVALFDEGRALMAAGKHAEACPKLAESQRLDPGIGTLFNLSDCHERTGRTASAWIGFRDVAAQAAAAGQADREQVARRRAASLEPRLSRLRIVVSPGAAARGLEVTRDGVAVGEALWGTPVPVDPGEHAVSAAAPARARWETTVKLDQPGVVTVEVPPLAPGGDATEPAPAAKPPATPPVLPDPAPAPPPGAPSGAPAPEAGSWRTPVGFVAMGAGAAAMGVGTALAFAAKSTFNESNEGGRCDAGGRCDDEGLALRDDAVAQGNVATAVFVAGAAVAIGGTILWLSAPTSSQRSLTGPTPPRLAVGIGPAGVRLRGAF